MPGSNWSGNAASTESGAPGLNLVGVAVYSKKQQHCMVSCLLARCCQVCLADFLTPARVKPIYPGTSRTMGKSRQHNPVIDIQFKAVSRVASCLVSHLIRAHVEALAGWIGKWIKSAPNHCKSVLPHQLGLARLNSRAAGLKLSVLISSQCANRQTKNGQLTGTYYLLCRRHPETGFRK
jgi:hypothetical protein